MVVQKRIPVAVNKSLDRYFQEKILNVFDHICQLCFIKDDTVTVHHIITRKCKSLRHDARNGVPLCVHCHTYAHKEPSDFRTWASGWLQRNYCIAYEDLKRLSNQ